jgi:hypothetical protein
MKISKKVFEVASEKAVVPVVAGAGITQVTENIKVSNEPLISVDEKADGSNNASSHAPTAVVCKMPCGAGLYRLSGGKIVVRHGIFKTPSCWECQNYFFCRESVKANVGGEK